MPPRRKRAEAFNKQFTGKMIFFLNAHPLSKRRNENYKFEHGTDCGFVVFNSVEDTVTPVVGHHHPVLVRLQLGKNLLENKLGRRNRSNFTHL